MEDDNNNIVVVGKQNFDKMPVGGRYHSKETKAKKKKEPAVAKVKIGKKEYQAIISQQRKKKG